jgi:hypothetical protein
MRPALLCPWQCDPPPSAPWYIAASCSTPSTSAEPTADVRRPRTSFADSKFQAIALEQSARPVAGVLGPWDGSAGTCGDSGCQLCVVTAPGPGAFRPGSLKLVVGQQAASRSFRTSARPPTSPRPAPSRRGEHRLPELLRLVRPSRFGGVLRELLVAAAQDLPLLGDDQGRDAGHADVGREHAHPTGSSAAAVAAARSWASTTASMLPGTWRSS